MSYYVGAEPKNPVQCEKFWRNRIDAEEARFGADWVENVSGVLAFSPSGANLGVFFFRSDPQRLRFFCWVPFKPTPNRVSPKRERPIFLL